jgi:large subunit ribosomal protein L5
MAYVPTLKKKYLDEVVPAISEGIQLIKSVMQVPRLEKIVINQVLERYRR